MANKRQLTRREFVSKTTRGDFALGAGMAVARPWARVLGANGRIRLGVIGPGGRGRALMRAAKVIPGVELAAVCDVYDENVRRAHLANMSYLEGRKVRWDAERTQPG